MDEVGKANICINLDTTTSHSKRERVLLADDYFDTGSDSIDEGTEDGGLVEMSEPIIFSNIEVLCRARYRLESDEDLLTVMDQMEMFCHQLNILCDDLSSDLTKLKLLAYTHDITLPEIMNNREESSTISILDYHSDSDNSIIEHEYDFSESEESSEEIEMNENIEQAEEKIVPEESKEGDKNCSEEGGCESPNFSFRLNHIEVGEEKHVKFEEISDSLFMQVEGKSDLKNELATPIIAEGPVEQPVMATKEQFISFYDDGFMECENIVDDTDFGVFGSFDESKFGKEDDENVTEVHDAEAYLNNVKNKSENEENHRTPKVVKKRKLSTMISSLIGDRSNLLPRTQSIPSHTEDLSLTEGSTFDSVSPVTLSSHISKFEFESMERCLISLFTGDIMCITKRGASKPIRRYVWVDTQKMHICWSKGSSKNVKNMKEFPITEIRMGTFLASVSITEEQNNRSFTVWSIQGSQLLFSASSESLRNDWVKYITAVLEIKHRKH